jgi:formiminoglutamase
MGPLPIILSIPHAGLWVPKELSGRLAISADEIFDESDAFAREIYGMGDLVLAEVSQDLSRVVVDTNRPPEALPPKVPDGAVKSATAFGRRVWLDGAEPNEAETGSLLERFWHPYHRRLDELLAKHEGTVRLLIDCHTMASIGPGGARRRRPLVCLGNLGTPSGATGHHGRLSLPQAHLLRLHTIMAEVFAREIDSCTIPRPVRLNQPFPGGYIVQRVSAQGFWALQIELSRELYLRPPWFDQKTGQIDEGRLKELNAKLREALSRFVSSSLEA